MNWSKPYSMLLFYKYIEYKLQTDLGDGLNNYGAE
jgi:hypothetical protein